MQNFTQVMVNALVAVFTDALLPLMTFAFFASVVGKLLVYITVSRQGWFVRELDKRVLKHLEGIKGSEETSYFVALKRMLERTYYELFKVRSIMMRRKRDYITSPLDRLFAVQLGCARMISDTLLEARILKRHEAPRFLDLAKSSSAYNPAFSKAMGWIPVGPFNHLLNLMPGLFIIGGIFGTFLGIMEALPELSHMNLDDPQGAKLIMDTFLLKISFSISTSVVGIVYSVALTLLFTLLSPDKVFVNVIDTYARILSRIWDSTTTNEVPADLENFDQNRDPVEALAAMAVSEELQGPVKKRA